MFPREEDSKSAGWEGAANSGLPKLVCGCSSDCYSTGSGSSQSGEGAPAGGSSSWGATALVNSECTAGSAASLGTTFDKFSLTVCKSDSVVNGLCRIPNTFSDLLCALSKSAPNPDMKTT